MTNILSLVKALDTTTPTHRQIPRMKTRRQRRQEMRSTLKVTNANNQK